MNDDNIQKAQNVSPFVRYVASTIPMVFDNSLSYYEALGALAKSLQDTVNVVNNNATVTEEYIQLTKEMKEYMDHYFDNLDVQEEINNKLDQMVEDGTLQEIITTYIQANVAWTFDTVADMKQATNLVNGSYARTLGFHSLNDGGGALYKITNTGTANEMDIIAVGDLYANLITNSIVNVKQFGAYGDGTHDDSSIIQNLLNRITSGTIYFPKGRYVLSSSINFCKKDVNIKGDGINQTVFIDNNTTVNHYSFIIDNFPNAESIEFIENNTYKDFSIIANEYTKIGLYINGTAHCKYENIHIHNVPNVENTFAMHIASEVCSYENVGQPANVGNETYSYAYYGMQIERVNRPGRDSLQSCNNIFNKCLIEHSTYNLVATDAENCTFISCAIEWATNRDITLQTRSKYNVFIGCGTEVAPTSLLDESTQATFINCYMTGAVILGGKGVFINGGFYGTFGAITTQAGSYGIVQNININHDGTQRPVTFDSYNYTFTNVYDDATSSYVHCYQGRKGTVLDNNSWTNNTNKTVLAIISGNFADVTSVSIVYPNSSVVSCLQPVNVLTPGSKITVQSNGAFTISYVPID